MKFERRILMLLMCTVLALSACNKKLPDTSVEEQQVPVGFSAKSQAVWVKSGETPTTSFPYTNFGVWGIARMTEAQSPYILWSSSQLTAVNAPEGPVTNHPTNPNPVVFTPVTAAYWLKDYAYDFLAVAPFNDEGLSAVAFTRKEASETGKDYMTFTYDLTPKYEEEDYDFDFLGAAAQTGPVAGGRKDSQDLMFWHLLSQISIDLKFGKDAKNEQIVGVITAIRLSPNPSANYTLTYDNTSTNSTAPTGISCTTITPTAANPKPVLAFTNNAATASIGPINIVPQSASDLALEIDFTITESPSSTADYTGFTVNLNVPGKLEAYEANGKYSYDITIGSKAAISFGVEVNGEWIEAQTPEINM